MTEWLWYAYKSTIRVSCWLLSLAEWLSLPWCTLKNTLEVFVGSEEKMGLTLLLLNKGGIALTAARGYGFFLSAASILPVCVL